MKTQINGKYAPWPAEVYALWEVKTKDWPAGDRAKVTLANYFTPRPYVDQYNRGSDREGFTYILGLRDVCQLSWQGVVKKT